jgi:hypothetical protein
VATNFIIFGGGNTYTNATGAEFWPRIAKKPFFTNLGEYSNVVGDALG